MSRKEMFVGIDVFTGGTSFFCPELFLGQTTNVNEKSVIPWVSISKEDLEEANFLIIQNNLEYRLAVDNGTIKKKKLSKKITGKFCRYISRKQEDKARSLISGYLNSYSICESVYQGEELRERGLDAFGIMEKEDAKKITGYAYPCKGNYVFNIPNYLFAIYNPTGEIQIAKKSFLKDAAKFESSLRGNNLVREVYIPKEYLKKINYEENEVERNVFLRVMLEDLLDKLSKKTKHSQH